MNWYLVNLTKWYVSNVITNVVICYIKLLGTAIKNWQNWIFFWNNVQWWLGSVWLGRTRQTFLDDSSGFTKNRTDQKLGHRVAIWERSHDWQTALFPSTSTDLLWQPMHARDLEAFCAPRIEPEKVEMVFTSSSSGTRGVSNSWHCVTVNSSLRGVFR